MPPLPQAIDPSIKVLLVEDSEADVLQIERFLQKKENDGLSYHVDSVDTLGQAIERIDATSYDVVLLDLNIVDSMGLDTLSAIKEHAPIKPVIIVTTGLGEESIAFEALKIGAQDYLIKGDLSNNELRRSIRYSLERGASEGRLKLFQELLNSSNDSILVISPEDGSIIETNGETNKSLDFNRDEVFTMKFSDLYSGSTIQNWPEFVKSLRENQIQIMELTAKSKHEIKTPVEANIKLVNYGRTEYLIAIIRDITERKRVDKIKDEFISIASHELRTPVAILQGAIENLCDDVPNNPQEHQELLDIAKSNLSRLTSMINNILDITHLTSSKSNVKRQEINTQALIKNLAKDLSPLLAEKNLTLELDVDTAPSFFGEEELIVRVLNNLLMNAFKHANTKIKIHGQETINEQNRFIQICVSNDGPSISPQDYEKLFQKFFQIDPDQKAGSGKYRGVGLGLTICKEIVQKHGGTIWVKSEENGPTTFCFKIPKRLEILA